MVATNYLTRYAKAAALPSGTALEVAKFFLLQIVLRDSAPRVVFTNRGAAFSVEQTTRRFVLDHNSTSTAAELVAIREAIRHISGEQPQEWCIFTDSKPALQIVRQFLLHAAHQALALEITELLSSAHEKGHRTVLQWVPGHCGLDGNATADAEARGALNNGLRTFLPFSGPEITCRLSKLMRSATAAYWAQPDARHIRLKRLNPAMQFSVPRVIPRPHA